MSIKDIREDQVDNVLGAIGAVLKAIISVARCVDDVKKNELNEKPAV
ncbi:hypothetical protein VPHD148_0240 [Vibrio phage D148]